MTLTELNVTYGVEAYGMAVRVSGQTAVEFTRSIPWRIGMFSARAYMEKAEGQVISFRSGLTYKQCLDVVDSLKGAEDYGIPVTLDESFSDFIARNRTYIEERSRVGLAIKARDPSVEESYREFAQVVGGIMVRKLRERQMHDAFFMTSVRWSANFSVPGSGKTASVLGAYSFLRAAGKIKRLVVVCPKSAFDSWKTEWDYCFSGVWPGRCFCLGDVEVSRLSKEQKKRSLKMDSGRFDMFLLNYEAMGSYVDELIKLVRKETLLVFDEVHRVKALNGQRAKWALSVARPAQYVAVLTGTPIPNTYQDIYNFLHILYPDDYDSFFGFEPALLKGPNPHEIDEINHALKPFFCRTNKDELGVPRPEADRVYTLKATSVENQLLHILTAAYAKNPLALIIRVLQLESNPQMLKYALDPEDFEFVLDQTGEDVTDIDFVDYSDDVPKLIDACGISTKVEACIQLVKKLAGEGKPVIVWGIFVRSILLITDLLKSAGITACAIYGAVPLDQREEILKDFRNGLFQVLVTNPHTLAESVSLHQICHDGVYFEYSYNLVHLLQSKDRIHRLGLQQGQYTQYHFMQVTFNTDAGTWSLDNKIYRRLLEKESTMLEAIDGGYLECGYVDEEDVRIILGDLFNAPVTTSSY